MPGWKRIALWGFLLNMIWEFVQCTVLYDMWTWNFWKASVYMWGAILGDVLIVLGIVYLAARFVGYPNLSPPTRRGWIALFGISFIASILLEWLALYLELWGYSVWMPTIEVFGFSVGLAPIVQITLLPPLSVLLAFRQTDTASEERRMPESNKN